MSLPHAIVIVRALATIPICLLVLAGTPVDDVAALVVFVIAALTDAVDGPIARSRGEVTTLGIAIDPLADKILVLGTLSALVARGLAPGWAVGVIGARELVAVFRRAGRVLPARADGKAKTAAQMVACGGLIAAASLRSEGLLLAADAILGLAVALTVLSGVRLIFRASQTRADAR